MKSDTFLVIQKLNNKKVFCHEIVIMNIYTYVRAIGIACLHYTKNR